MKSILSFALSWCVIASPLLSEEAKPSSPPLLSQPWDARLWDTRDASGFWHQTKADPQPKQPTSPVAKPFSNGQSEK